MPDVLILDMAMPGGSGYDVLQAVKQGPCAPLIIVGLTNFPAYRQKSLEAGADYFFDKSAEYDQLLLLEHPSGMLALVHKRRPDQLCLWCCL
jgi:two-component system OmpR family response regulator